RGRPRPHLRKSNRRTVGEGREQGPPPRRRIRARPPRAARGDAPVLSLSKDHAMSPSSRGLTADQVKLVGDLLVPRVMQELRGEFQRLRDDFTDALARQEGQTGQRFAEMAERLAALESPENRRLADLDGRLRTVERLCR